MLHVLCVRAFVGLILYIKNHPCQPVMVLRMVLSNNLKTKNLIEFHSPPPPPKKFLIKTFVRSFLSIQDTMDEWSGNIHGFSPQPLLGQFGGVIEGKLRFLVLVPTMARQSPGAKVDGRS